MNESGASPSQVAYIGLGGNQGFVLSALQAACQALGSMPQSRVVALSPFYQTAPIQAEGGDFINLVAQIETGLDPYALLVELHHIEALLGRRRRATDAPNQAARPIDLDLLLVGQMIITSTPLVLPHPRMHQRAFVLRPLADLNPHLNIPGQGPVLPLLDQVLDQEITLLPTPAWAMPLSGLLSQEVI